MALLREFESLAEFAMHVTEMQLMVRHQMRSGMDKALKLIEDTAKSEIGHYQPETGQFSAWAQLADSTEKEKERLGAPLGAPLLRHGGLYASFGHEVVSDLEGIVGSTDPTLIYHEFGTEKMPPRPVLGPAVLVNKRQIEGILGKALVEGIIGGEVVAGGAEYFGGDFTP